MTIKTKLHILAENIPTEQLRIHRDGRYARIPAKELSTGAKHPRVAKMLAAADYVIDKEVVDLLRRDDCEKSLRALCKAGIARLPVSPMVIEYSIDKAYHEFILLEEVGQEIHAYYCTLFTETNVAMLAEDPVLMRIDEHGVGYSIPKGTSLNVVKRMLGDPVASVDSSDEAFKVVSMSACIVAMQLALLMLNTMGIEKREVDVHTLNKARAARGRHAIPHHSTVHIGTIYRRDGTAVKRDGGGGWHMPMHIRQAHTRRQHHGPNNSEVKHIFVPMTIVNYRDGDEVRMPKKIVRI